MKTLHRYLLRQMLSTLVMTVLVFGFVLLLGNLLRQIVSLLINRQATLFTFLEAIGYLAPYVLMYALPMGLLTATLLTFGRFSADQELTAARAGGVSLLSLSTPVLLLSLLLTGVSAVVSLDVAPRCHGAYRELLYRVGVQSATALIPEGIPIRDFKQLILYVGKVDGDTLQDVKVVHLDERAEMDRFVRADRAQLNVTTNGVVSLKLFNPLVTVKQGGAWMTGISSSELLYQLTPDSRAEGVRKKSISEMTFWELERELRDLQRRLRMPIPPRLRSSDQLRQWQKEWERQRNTLISPILTAIHSNLSFAFACFSFTLVGIPLAIRTHRRETSIGVALALVLALLFQSFIMVGESLAAQPAVYPYLIVWLPNFLFQSVGCVLLRRANRGL